MRRSFTSAARIFTVFSFIALLSLSLVVLFQHDALTVPAVHSTLRRRDVLARSADPPPISSSSSTASVSSTATSSPATVSSTSTPTSTPTTTSSAHSSSTPPTETLSSSTQISSSSTQRAASSSSSPVHSSSSSSVRSTVSSSSSSLSSSSVLSSSSSSTSARSTLSVPNTASSGQALPVTPLQFTSLPTDTATASGSAASSLVTDNSSTSASSGNSFFSNTGAVAATFTVVGLVGVGCVSGLLVYLRKRRSRSEERDIFDDEYKYGNYGGDNDRAGSPDGSLAGHENAQPMSYAQQHTYVGPDTHFGSNDGGMDYGLEFPPAIGSGNRDSTASNHAGFGVYGTVQHDEPAPTSNHTQFPAPPVVVVTDSNDAAYDLNMAYEPAIAEMQSPYVVPMREPHASVDSYYLNEAQHSGTHAQ